MVFLKRAVHGPASVGLLWMIPADSMVSAGIISLMRRADRLFQIVQILRRSRQPVTAAALATELEVSKRSVYRDMADLVGQRVPIQGEAGLGYVLGRGFDMPPLMLTPDQVEAAVLGAQLVARLPDPLLAAAARDVISKIAAVVPDHLRPFINAPSVAAKPPDGPLTNTSEMQRLRSAARKGLKLRLLYRAASDDVTERTVWPVVVGYDEAHAILIAWCELRNGFRHFRTDRILSSKVLDEPYAARRSDLRRRWELWREAERRSAAAG